MKTAVFSWPSHSVWSAWIVLKIITKKRRWKNNLKGKISTFGGLKQQLAGRDNVWPILSASLGADLFIPLRLEPEIGCGSIAGGSPQSQAVIDFKQTGSQGKRIKSPPFDPFGKICMKTRSIYLMCSTYATLPFSLPRCFCAFSQLSSGFYESFLKGQKIWNANQVNLHQMDCAEWRSFYQTECQTEKSVIKALVFIFTARGQTHYVIKWRPNDLF